MKPHSFTKTDLLAKGLEKIAAFGWTTRALSEAERDGGQKGVFQLYFPGGLADFTHAFHLWVDEGMHSRLAARTDFETARVRDKVFYGVMARLDTMLPHRAAVQRLFARQLWPWNGWRGLAALGHAADAVWRAAGDRSTDYNYYTKRLLLSGVYIATLRFWLRDHSKDQKQTQEFLRRRIENVMKFGRAIGGIKQRFSRAA